jgi:hypothetical protein
MKVNSMNIKISKSEWQSIGSQMGWIKRAQSTYGDSYWAERDGPMNKGEDAGSSVATVSEKDQEIMGEIVDHNARVRAKLGGGEKANDSDRMAAKAIVSKAKSIGHRGLGVNENGMIVKTTIIDDWLGRSGPDREEPIKADTKPHRNKEWTATISNNPGPL